jgi:hypothetical protein
MDRFHFLVARDVVTVLLPTITGMMRLRLNPL